MPTYWQPGKHEIEQLRQLGHKGIMMKRDMTEAGSAGTASVKMYLAGLERMPGHHPEVGHQPDGAEDGISDDDAAVGAPARISSDIGKIESCAC